MKFATRILLLLLTILLQWAPAQTPAKRLPFSADMEIISNHAGDKDRYIKGKIYVAYPHLRMDMQAPGKYLMILIVNKANRTSAMLLPGSRMYMEVSLGQEHPMTRSMAPDIQALDPKNPCAPEKDTLCKNLGTEQVNGRTCDHWRVTKNGTLGDVWIDQSLHVRIKIISEGRSWQLTNLKEGEQAPGLFEIPTGYRKMETRAR